MRKFKTGDVVKIMSSIMAPQYINTKYNILAQEGVRLVTEILEMYIDSEAYFVRGVDELWYELEELREATDKERFLYYIVGPHRED